MRKDITIVIPSYKNKDWYKRNLNSVLIQNYPPKHLNVIYTDDCSPDGTADLVEKFMKEKNPKFNFKLIKNKKRVGAMKNLYDMIHSVDDEHIIITLDADDWFAHQNVLQKINQEYQNPNVWMTYGQYRSYPDNRIGCSMQVPPQVIQRASYRQYRWCTSHLRTFYSWLFKLIKKEDFIGSDGKFYAMAWDLAFQYPMLELSGMRSKFISDVLYIYNVATPINDSKVNIKLQQNTERIIRAKSRYHLLVKRP